MRKYKGTSVKKKEPLESAIQAAICDYLALKKLFFWRQNTAPTFDKTKGVFRAMPKYAMKGVADIIVITDGGFAVFLEVKRPKGKQSEDQKLFEERCKKIGCEYYVVTSVDKVKELGL